MTLVENLSSLREISEMARALLLGVRKIQVEMQRDGMEIPETLKRTLHRVDMDLDDLALDLKQLTE